jgi:hypothetical protein
MDIGWPEQKTKIVGILAAIHSREFASVKRCLTASNTIVYTYNHSAIVPNSKGEDQSKRPTEERWK